MSSGRRQIVSQYRSTIGNLFDLTFCFCFLQKDGSLKTILGFYIDDRVVFVGSGDNKVYCLSAADGSKIWDFATGGDVTSSPAVVDNVVHVGSQ